MAPLLPFSLMQSCTFVRIHLLSDICYRLVCAGHLRPTSTIMSMQLILLSYTHEMNKLINSISSFMLLYKSSHIAPCGVML